MFRASTGVFVIGGGGIGLPRGPAPVNALRGDPPERAPDVDVRSVTSSVQTLLYRYAGNDRNPIHADVETAQRAGLPRADPHGPEHFGFAARAIVHAWVPAIP